MTSKTPAKPSPHLAEKSILSQRLRLAREAMFPKVSQVDVANRFNLSKSAISLWESGGSEPSAENIAQMSRWFGVSCDWLLGISDTTTPSIQTNMVAIIDPSDMAIWRLDRPVASLQTNSKVCSSTCAAMHVSSDAVGSVCPVGSTIVISKSITPKPGDIVAATLNTVASPGLPVLRRLIQDGNSHFLVADGHGYPAIPLKGDVQIIGVGVEVVCRTSLVRHC